jgi:pimeloyl-ACP methyl ester carboxylesterase
VTLVLLPGMDGTGQLFTPFVAALGCEFNVKVVAYPTAAPLGYEELESVARAALPTEGPYVILGESFSGPIAVSLAASGSPGLKGLVLCCSFVRNPRPAFSGLRSLVAVLPLALAPVSLLGRLLLGRFSTSALQAALAKSLSQVSPSAIRARLQAVLSVNVSAKLSAVKVPVLYLRASRDSVVPASASALVAKLSPRTRVVELEAPHFLLQAAPAKAAQEVGAFVREVQNAL